MRLKNKVKAVCKFLCPKTKIIPYCPKTKRTPPRPKTKWTPPRPKTKSTSRVTTHLTPAPINTTIVGTSTSLLPTAITKRTPPKTKTKRTPIRPYTI